VTTPFVHIVDFRDALSHRIALYIPPYIVPDENDAAYGELEVRKFSTKNMDEYDRLKVPASRTHHSIAQAGERHAAPSRPNKRLKA
jgi:hypothetical protein